MLSVGLQADAISPAAEFDSDLFAALVVGLRHDELDQQEPQGRDRGERGPQHDRIAVDDHLERLHDEERQGPREGRGQRLQATVLGRYQLGAYEPRYGAQAQPERGDERAQDKQYGYLPRRSVQGSWRNK